MGRAHAADDPVGARQTLMTGMGSALKPVIAIARGEARFDAAKVKAAGELISGNITRALTFFPAGSAEGETEALPKIWQTPDDFKAHDARLAEDARLLASATSAADVGKSLGVIGKDCKSCHESYRKPD